jgi:hypothetical protein
MALTVAGPSQPRNTRLNGTPSIAPSTSGKNQDDQLSHSHEDGMDVDVDQPTLPQPIAKAAPPADQDEVEESDKENSDPSLTALAEHEGHEEDDADVSYQPRPPASKNKHKPPAAAQRTRVLDPDRFGGDDSDEEEDRKPKPSGSRLLQLIDSSQGSGPNQIKRKRDGSEQGDEPGRSEPVTKKRTNATANGTVAPDSNQTRPPSLRRPGLYFLCLRLSRLSHISNFQTPNL